MSSLFHLIQLFLRGNVTLLDPARHREPDAVAQDEEGALPLGRVQLRGLEGRHPGHEVDGDGDCDPAPQHQQPHPRGERRQEGEVVDVFLGRGHVEDRDAQVKERHREVDHLLPVIVDTGAAVANIDLGSE